MTATRTHCVHGHELIGDNVYQRPEGGIACRTCRKNNTDRFVSSNPNRSHGKKAKVVPRDDGEQPYEAPRQWRIPVEQLTASGRRRRATLDLESDDWVVVERARKVLELLDPPNSLPSTPSFSPQGRETRQQRTLVAPNFGWTPSDIARRDAAPAVHVVRRHAA